MPNRSLNRALRTFLLVLSPGFFVACAHAAAPVPADLSPDHLELVNTRAKSVEYHRRKAPQLLPVEGREHLDESMLAILKGSDLKDGTIEVDVAGSRREGTADTNRGFIGIAFRVREHGSGYGCFYLRPSNARAEDQLQRNHSIQYVADLDFGWRRLRTEHPGVYESYSDLVPGEWTKVKIVVAGTKAKIYVNGSSQPALVVNDLLRNDSGGQIALWSHSSTEGYFSGLKVSSSN